MLCVGVRLPWYQLGVAALVQDDVLGLEVPVDDAPALEEGQRLDHAARVEPRGAVVKGTPSGGRGTSTHDMGTDAHIHTQRTH